MKVWILYFIGNRNNISIPCDNDADVDDNAYVYGITNNEKLLTSFMEIRKKKYFKIKKLDLLPSEYEELCGRYRGAVIDNVTLITKDDNWGVHHITLPLTENEKQIATDGELFEYTLFDEEYWRFFPDPRRFNKEIQKALYTLQYTQIYNIVMNVETDSYESPEMDFDELQMFVTNYTSILKA